MLNRDLLQQKLELKTVVIDVPELGDQATLRMLTAAETNRLHRRANADGVFDATVFQTLLIAMTLVGEDGSNLFPEEEAPVLAGWPAGVVARLFLASKRHNKLGSEEVDEAEKNSPASPSAASS